MARIKDEEITGLDNYKLLKWNFNDLNPATITSIVGDRKRNINLYKDVVNSLST